jgi:hypothetical protein
MSCWLSKIFFAHINDLCYSSYKNKLWVFDMLLDIGGPLHKLPEFPDFSRLCLEDAAPPASLETKLPSVGKKAFTWGFRASRGKKPLQMSEYEAQESLQKINVEIEQQHEKFCSLIHRLGAFAVPPLHQCLTDLRSVSGLVFDSSDSSEGSVQKFDRVQKQMRSIFSKIEVQKQLCLDQLSESIISGIDRDTLEKQIGFSGALLKLIRESVVKFIETGATVRMRYEKWMIKCRSRAGQIQVLGKILVGEGGMKSIEKCSIFFGPSSPFGSVFVVAKPRKDSPKALVGGCLSSLYDELRCSRSLKEKQAHHIVDQLPVYKEKSPQQLKGLAMPWYDRGDANAFVRSSSAHLSKTELLKRLHIVRHVAIALSAFHEQGFIHCDLKPSNVFLKSAGKGTCDAFLGDFGLALQRGEGGFGCYGSHFYIAPEVWRCRERTPAIDMWALGLIMLEMFCGKTEQAIGQVFPSLGLRDPLQKQEEISLFRKKMVEKLDLQKPLHSLVEQLLREDPEGRPIASDVVLRIEKIMEDLKR